MKNTNVTVYKETCIVFRSKASEDSYTAKKEPIGDRVPLNRTWKEELKINANGKKAAEKADQVLAEIITPGMSDLEKVMAVNDYLVEHVTYTHGDYSPYGPLLRGKGVCQGYSFCAELLLNKAGVTCERIEGYADVDAEEYTNDILDALHYDHNRHEWNLVKIDGHWYHLDGHWYHLDVTYNDAFIEKKQSTQNLYTYFLLSDEQISCDHIWRKAFYPKATTPFYNESELKQLHDDGYPAISGTISLPEGTTAPKGGVEIKVSSYDADVFEYNRDYVIPEGKNQISFQIFTSKKYRADDFVRRITITTSTKGYEEVAKTMDPTVTNYKAQLVAKSVNLLRGKIILPDGVPFDSEYKYEVSIDVYEKIEGQNGLSGCYDQEYHGVGKPGQKELYFDFDCKVPTNEYEYVISYYFEDYSEVDCPVVRGGYLTESGAISQELAYLHGDIAPLTSIVIKPPKAVLSSSDTKNDKKNEVKKVNVTKTVQTQIINTLKSNYVGNRSKIANVKTLEQVQKLYSRKPDQTSEAKNGDQSIYYFTKFKNGLDIRVVYSIDNGSKKLVCDTTIANLNITSKNYMSIMKKLNSYLKTAVGTKKDTEFCVIDLSDYDITDYNSKQSAAIFKKVQSGKSMICCTYDFGEELYQLSLECDSSGDLRIYIARY